MNHTTEEVRARAEYEREFDEDGKTVPMLTAYATLLEQIERAKAGVTNEVVAIACNAMGLLVCGDDPFLDENDIRKGLQSVAHLLPNGECGRVDESAEVRLGEYLKSQAGYACLNDRARRNVANTFLAVAYPTLPPAQTAQVDQVNELLAVIHGDGGHYQAEHGVQKAAKDALQKVIEMMTKIATNPPAEVAQVDGLRQRSAKLASITADPTTALNKWEKAEIHHFICDVRDAPTAEPVVQGEAVATLHADGYWTWKGTPPHESNYAGWKMDVYPAQPRAVPSDHVVI